MTTPSTSKRFQEELSSVLSTSTTSPPPPPPCVYIHSPTHSPLLHSILKSTLSSPSSTSTTIQQDQVPTIQDILPKTAWINLSTVHSTKQLFDSILNQFTSWGDESTRWNETLMGFENWDQERGFEGLKVVKRRQDDSTSNSNGRKRRKGNQGQEINDDTPTWELKWDHQEEEEETTMSSTKNKKSLGPIRNTLESFHQSLKTIFDHQTSSSTTEEELEEEEDPFEPGIQLSTTTSKSSSSQQNRPTTKTRKRSRRYIVIEHGELLSELAGGSASGGGMTSATKETGIGMTFQSTVYRLSQITELPITVIIINRFPWRKSRESLVGLMNPVVLEYVEPSLDQTLMLLNSRFASSPLSHPISSQINPPISTTDSSSTTSQLQPSSSSPTIDFTHRELCTLFSTYTQIVAMALSSTLGSSGMNDKTDELGYWVSRLWGVCLEVVKGSNPRIPIDRLDRLKIALQPFFNDTFQRELGQPRKSLLHPIDPTTSNSRGGPTSASSSAAVATTTIERPKIQHGFSGTIKPIERGPQYLDELSNHHNEADNVPPRFESSISTTTTTTPSKPSTLSRSNSLQQLPSNSTSNSTSSTTTTASSISSLSRSLPTTSRLLLISSFLAAHNPPKSDVRMFVKVDEMEGVARKGKKGRRGNKTVKVGVNSKKKKGNLAAFMTGGKSFSLERLLAIFESIVDERREYLVGTVAVHSQIQTLISLRLLHRTSSSADTTKNSLRLLDGVKLKCPLSRDDVDQLAKSVGFAEWKERLVDIDD